MSRKQIIVCCVCVKKITILLLKMEYRKSYLDWMKALGMFTIIWGHCFPDGMSEFIYAFNVPVFFIISGYLSKRDEPISVCWKKVWDGLVLPYLILAFIKCAGFMLKHTDDGLWIKSIMAILCGFHSLGDASGCSNLWFVYSLIILKLFFCVFDKRKLSILLVVLLAFIVSIVYNVMDCEWYWAVPDAVLALPFFFLGNMLANDWKESYECFINRFRRISPIIQCASVLILAIMVYIFGYYNGSAKMYLGLYGESFTLFLIGGISGTLMLTLISLLLETIKWKGIYYANMGMLVTLTFHRELLHPLLKLIRNVGASAKPCVCK